MTTSRQVPNKIRLFCSLTLPFIAAALQHKYWDLFQPFIFVLFYPAVFTCAWLAGLLGGVLATLISIWLILWLFINPLHGFVEGNSSHLVALSVFCIVGFLMAWVNDRLRRKQEEVLGTQQKLEQKHINEMIAQSRFRVMFDQSPMGMALVDSFNGQLYEVNEAFANIVGRSREQLATIDWMQITHPDDVQADLDNMQRLNAGEISGFQMDKRYLRPDQSIVWISLTVAPVKVERGERPKHLCLIENISIRLETQKQLAEAQAIAAKFQSEQRYAALVKQNLLGIAEADQSGNLTFVNDRFCSITGYDREQILGLNLLAMTHPDDRARYEEQLARIVSAGDSFVIENRYLRPNGEMAWVFNTVSALCDESGQLANYTAMVLDITERKRHEQQLNQTMELLHLAECSASSGVWSWDLINGEVLWSEELCALFGLAPQNTIATSDIWRSVVHQDDLAVAEQALATAIRDHQPLAATYRILHSDGSIHWIDAYGNARYNEKGEPLRFAGLCIDVTQREQTLTLLRDSEQRFRELFVHLPVAYQSLDIEGRWLDANQKMADLLGFDAPEQMIGLDFVDYWHEDLSVLNQFRATNRLETELQLYRRDTRKLIDVMVTGHIQRELDGTFMRTHCVLVDITERLELEKTLQGLNESLEQQVAERTEALQQSENRFKQILKNHPIAVLLVDEQGGIQEANYKAGELLRCVPESLIDINVDALIPLSRRSGHDKLRSHYLKNPEHRQMSANREVMVLAKDGTEIPVEIGLGPVILDGKPFVITALNDITRRKAAEISLRESEETLKRAQSVAKIGSWKLVASNDTFMISEETRRMFGFDSNTITYADWLKPIHPADKAAVESAWQACLQGAAFEVIFRIQVEEHLRWIKAIAQLHFDSLDKVTDGMGTVQDISEIKETELQMQEAMEYLKLATKASGLGIWAWDLKSNQLKWDERMQELYGFDNTPQDISMDQWRSCIHPDDLEQTEAALKKALSNGVSFDKVFRIHLPNGNLRYIQPDSIFEYDELGKPIRMIGINRDVTQTIEQQTRLNEAKQTAEWANESKSNFLANMSHEIRTPMNAIVGLSSLVLDTELTRQQRDYLNKVQTASKALMHLINDILDYSKIEAGHLSFYKTLFHLEDSINNSISLFSLMLNEKGLAFISDVAPDVPKRLIGDVMRLEQVVNNLIGNAIKFTAQGEIRLKVERLPYPNEQSQAILLRFSVSDTGIGIKPERIKYLFNPFTQADETISRRFGGTGLGLSISKRLVELMGGEITVSSVEGQGTVFSFTAVFDCGDLQSVTPSNETSPSSAVHFLESILGRKVLLVEDSPTNQLVARGYLENMQLNVTSASNGLEAIERVREQAFDAIFMDIQMPIMDGYEATRQIRKLANGLQVPIIALSASVLSNVKQACLDAGMNDHLSKPIDIRLLEKQLLKWITPQSITLANKQTLAQVTVSNQFIAIDHHALKPLLQELEQYLADNMLAAKKVAERIDLLLEKTAQSNAFLIVSNQVRQMRFKEALVALQAFKQQLSTTPSQDAI